MPMTNKMFCIYSSGLPTKDDIGFIPVKGDPYGKLKFKKIKYNI